MDKNTIQLTDLAAIITLALLTNGISELLSFFFIYRKKKYKELTKNIDIQSKKIETIKEGLNNTITQNKKRQKKAEEELADFNKQMMTFRFKSHLFIGLFMIFFMSIFNSVYQVIF